LVGKLAPEYGV